LEARDLIRALRRNKYDLSLDFQGLIKTGVLSYLSGARCRMGFSKNLVRERPAHWFYHRVLEKPGEEMHVARLNLELALAAGGARIQLQTGLTASEEDWQTIETRLAEAQLSQYVIINPGGAWPTKRWKTSNYAELADKIYGELNLRVVITTGPEEGHLYREIRDVCATRVPAHFPVTFMQLIPLCLKARLFVGGDTGPFHLACALGTPTVGIFGPTSPVRNGPLSLQDQTVFHKLHCSFCYGRTCPTQNECMDIGVDEVFGAVVRRLEEVAPEERRIIQ
jgi:ADP-heptose:LPS heptosyltransferase